MPSQKEPPRPDPARYKEELYGQFARIGSALASDRRLELIDLLAQGPRHVDALAAASGLSYANVSQHLQTLRKARLVESKREGNRVLYQLADDSVRDLWIAIRAVGRSRLAELSQLLREFSPTDAIEDLSREDLREALSSDRVLVLDVRPELEYSSGHLPGARSIPVELLSERIEDLPRDRPIVVYCRGHYCLFANEAVTMLRRHGFDALPLEGGWLEWSAEESA